MAALVANGNGNALPEGTTQLSNASGVHASNLCRWFRVESLFCFFETGGRDYHEQQLQMIESEYAGLKHTYVVNAAGDALSA